MSPICLSDISFSNIYKQTNKLFFYIHGSVHRDSVLIRSNKTQQYAGIYLLQVYSTCFGRPSRPSSGVHKTVTVASGTGHSNGATTCTRGCSYSFMYSWRWARWTPETCKLSVNKYLHTVASCWILSIHTNFCKKWSTHDPKPACG